MKKKLVTIAAIALIGCSSCASTNMVWMREGTTQYEFDQDMKECEYDAMKYVTPNYSYASSSLVMSLDMHLRKRDMMIKCLEVKGYRLQSKPASK